jgi:S-DNA-T family DNA segregation ATPase FtsK/SpoIIIE
VGIKRVISGPVFTRYDINLPKSVDFSKIAKYKREMAMAIHSGGTINIYPNYQEGSVSIEVPNSKRSIVGLKPILQSSAYQNSKPGSLMFAVGMDAEGKCLVEDLCKMPHMLVAGTTGSGKSVFLHEIIMSLIMKYSPEEVRLILIDPKYTEFSVYEGLPHLVINEIIANPAKVIVALNWAIAEMEHRYTLFAQMTQKGVAIRNIDEYNNVVEKKEDKLPKIVLIADEVADLMLTAKNDIENRVGRIAAKARAAGIHLVLATQRPSVNIITGVLKSNLPSRVALRVSSDTDSRVILDASGAENLLGKGDLFYKSGSMYSPKRAQSAWIDTPEIQKICDYIREHNEAYFDEGIAAYIDSEGKTNVNGVSSEETDDKGVEAVYIDALRFVVLTGTASISMIQRKCSIGFNKAGKIVDWMEANGYISPFDGGAKSRKVLLTKEEFAEKFGEI